MLEKKIPQPKTIRALERGLNIMQILQTKGSATLNEIYKVSGLPRPTILRILRTLEGAGWVRRGLEDGFYRNSFKIEGMVSSLDQTDKLAEISTPYLDALCRKASWPSDLTVLSSSGLCMELKETSRSLTPFLLNRDNIGHKINLPLSAVGRAYLAFCDENEGTTILANLRKSQNLANKLIYNEEKFLNDLNVEITQLGQNLDFDNLSRGERNRLILGLSFAFRDVWESLYQKINLLFIEGFVIGFMVCMMLVITANNQKF